MNTEGIQVGRRGTPLRAALPANAPLMFPTYVVGSTATNTLICDNNVISNLMMSPHSPKIIACIADMLVGKYDSKEREAEVTSNPTKPYPPLVELVSFP